MASSLFVSLLSRTKLGHGLLSGQYSKPPVKSELIEQVMKEEHKVCVPVCHVAMYVGELWSAVGVYCVGKRLLSILGTVRVAVSGVLSLCPLKTR